MEAANAANPDAGRESCTKAHRQMYIYGVEEMGTGEHPLACLGLGLGRRGVGAPLGGCDAAAGWIAND